MEAEGLKNKENEESKLNNSKNKFINLKSDYFIEKIFDIIHKKISLEIIKNNKYLQKRTNININNYKEYSENYSSIKIEIIPMKNKYGKFINYKKENEKYYHIYFNGGEEKEIKRDVFNEEDKVSKINIIIDYKIKSFNELFQNCECIESIDFKKFYRIDIDNISHMFEGCISLKEINFSNFKTNNISDMSYMFCGCESLKALNLSNFNTNNVTNMNNMFLGCISLIEINLSNFNTNNATDMSGMFAGCKSLTDINLSNFNSNNLNNTSSMFYGCTSLKEINISNLDTNKISNMYSMFSFCSNELKSKIKNKYKNIRKEAFLELFI